MQLNGEVFHLLKVVRMANISSSTTCASMSTSLRVRKAKLPRLSVLLFSIDNKTAIHPTCELLKNPNNDVQDDSMVTVKVKGQDLEARVLHLTETREEAVSWDKKYWSDLSESEVESTQEEVEPVVTKQKQVVAKPVTKGTKRPAENQKGKAKKKAKVSII